LHGRIGARHGDEVAVGHPAADQERSGGGEEKGEPAHRTEPQEHQHERRGDRRHEQRDRQAADEDDSGVEQEHVEHRGLRPIRGSGPW
jgi:hypothetical protein